MLGKLNWFLLTGLKTLVLLTWKWIGLFLRKNHPLRCWSWLSLLNWIGALTLPVLLKLPPQELEPWYIPWSFFPLRLLCISISLPNICKLTCIEQVLPACQVIYPQKKHCLVYHPHLFYTIGLKTTVQGTENTNLLSKLINAK